MKMADFCNPKTPQIISEKSLEEVTGYRTDYSARQDNPNPSYYSQSTTRAKGKNLLSHSSSSSTSNPVLYSSKSRTSTAITRERVYIDFICN